MIKKLFAVNIDPNLKFSRCTLKQIKKADRRSSEHFNRLDHRSV